MYAINLREILNILKVCIICLIKIPLFYIDLNNDMTLLFSIIEKSLEMISDNIGSLLVLAAE